MTGYINLYGPALRRERPIVSANQMALALAVLLPVLLGWYGFARIAAAQAQVEATAVDAQLKNQRERMAALAKAAGVRKPDASLTADLAQAEALLAGRDAVLASLESGRFGNAEGFSGLMRAFARQSLAGLWLTGFDISGGGAEMTINGRTTSADLLPTYIRRLRGESAFSAREFAALTISVPRPVAASAGAVVTPVSPPYLEFALASTHALAEKEARR